MTLSLVLIIILITVAYYANVAFAVTDEIKVNLTVEGGGRRVDPPEICDDGVDNDGDYLIDAADPDCASGPGPTEDCTDGIDNDGDGLIDANDPDCTVEEPVELDITNVIATPNSTSSLVTWNTNLVAISTISWGETLDYELGNSTEGTGSLSHTFLIENLDPGVTYYFKIDAYEVEDITNTDTEEGLTFTTLAGPDLEPPSIPTNFRADYDPTEEDIDLNWTNPTEPDFDVVRIMRRTNFYPSDENDGTFIYEGSGTFTEDINVVPGVTYYYSIFAKDTSGNWSAGGVDLAIVPIEEPPVCIGDDCPEPPLEVCDDGIDNDLDGLIDENCDLFPIPDPDIEPPPGFDDLIFRFRQGGNITLFTGDQTVYVDGNLPLEISVDYDELPEVLKTIGITLRHPDDPDKVFAFILRVNDEKTRYAATIAPLIESGSYGMSISILDFKNQGVVRFIGDLSVSEGRLFNANTITTLRDVIAPVGKIVGIAAGITQTVIAATNIRSIFDIYLVVQRLVGALLGFLGFRRKSRPWGTVYDAVTKRPLDPAYVTVNEVDGEEKGSAITDLDGRYGFLLPRGVYKIDAHKTHYEFPSRTLLGKSSDEMYENLYFGEPIATEEGQIIDRNIPLDPVGFDWNEFEKEKQGLYVIYSRKEKIKTAIFNMLYIFGLASTIFAIVFSPSLFNAIILGIYIFMFVFQWLWGRRHRATSVFSGKKGNPLSFAIIRVFTTELNQQVKALVTDEFGRFFLLISPGEYYLTVDAKQIDGSYRRVYRSENMELKKGVLPKDIVIEEYI